MIVQDNSNIILLIISVLSALILTILPLPLVIRTIQPMWVLLVLLSFLFLPLKRDVLIYSAFLSGLVLDIMQNTVFGEHALIFVTILYAGMFFMTKKQYLDFGQRIFLVTNLLLFARIFEFWFLKLNNISLGFNFSYWLPVLASALLWSWIFLLLEKNTHHLSLF